LYEVEVEVSPTSGDVYAFSTQQNGDLTCFDPLLTADVWQYAFSTSEFIYEECSVNPITTNLMCPTNDRILAITSAGVLNFTIIDANSYSISIGNDGTTYIFDIIDTAGAVSMNLYAYGLSQTTKWTVALQTSVANSEGALEGDILLDPAQDTIFLHYFTVSEVQLNKHTSNVSVQVYLASVATSNGAINFNKLIDAYSFPLSASTKVSPTFYLVMCIIIMIMKI